MNADQFDAHVHDLVFGPDIETLRKVKEAREFTLGFEPEQDTDYLWVWDYARDRYAEVMATRDALDDKAGEVIKYLGGGAGVVTLAALMGVRPENAYLLKWAVPSFIATLIALFFAVRARQPADIPFAPPVRSAARYAGEFKDRSRPVFLGQWHLVCTRMDAVNGLKGRRIQVAVWSFFAAVALLSLPFYAALG